MFAFDNSLRFLLLFVILQIGDSIFIIKEFVLAAVAVMDCKTMEI